MKQQPPDIEPFVELLRQQTPEEEDRERLRARLLAAGVAVGAAAGTTGAASSAAAATAAGTVAEAAAGTGGAALGNASAGATASGAAALAAAATESMAAAGAATAGATQLTLAAKLAALPLAAKAASAVAVVAIGGALSGVPQAVMRPTSPAASPANASGPAKEDEGRVPARRTVVPRRTGSAPATNRHHASPDGPLGPTPGAQSAPASAAPGPVIRPTPVRPQPAVRESLPTPAEPAARTKGGPDLDRRSMGAVRVQSLKASGEASSTGHGSEPFEAAGSVRPLAPKAVPSGLASEAALLERALRALHAGDRTKARQLLLEHRIRFPQGALRSERGRLFDQLDPARKGALQGAEHE